jgi:arabinogalactan oligomer/maltooligosaccharide transport system permease protein
MSENRPLTLVKGRQTQAALMRNTILRFLQYLWLVLTCLVVLVPILWMITASLTKGKLLSGVPLIPDFSKFSLEHYQYLFTYKSQSGAPYSDFVAAFLRSLQIAIVNTFAVVLLTTITGFVFSRFKFRGKKSILVSFLLLQMFPSFMGMIALFMIYRTFGWLNKPIYLVLIYAAGAIPYNTYLIRGYMRSIPLSIDEAAIIDGASKTQIFTRIVLPLSTPIIGFIAVNAFMAPWMDYMLPNQLLNMQNQTVAIFLYRLTDPMITLYYNPLNFMAGALVLAAPITLVQFYMQRFIVYGMASGAEKG